MTHVPELPEVEALARFLGERTAGRAVTRVEVAAIMMRFINLA